MKKSVKILLGIVVALLLGGVIGIGSAVLAIERSAVSSSVINGPWRTNLATGSEQHDMYNRAWFAIHALLGLNQSESIYYFAYTDDSGERLNGDNVYRIEGNVPDARWWSITVYGEDDFLIPNEMNCYSYSGNSVTYDQDGKYTIYLSKNQKPGDWIPLGDQKSFSLALRLYNPGDSVRNNPATVDLPHVIEEAGK
ncbi:MAG: DUF1214 domain-containing protein [Dehalococcoidia bacterium]